ncbi:MAG: DUF4276 family protein [Candidatus Adiutrix sp.]|nr:DUF4276 family protein [Candidatus Adiutrix sp.]
MLLNKLPALLRGMAKTAGIDAVVVVLDNDTRDCRLFLSELKSLANHSAPALNCLFRLAVEELEAWYLGDREALKDAYPGIKLKLLDNYAQDASCGTWELLADAIFPGGPKAVAQAGWPCPGIIKHEWAEKIGPAMSLEANVSPSFGKFRDGLRRLAAAERP